MSDVQVTWVPSHLDDELEKLVSPELVFHATGNACADKMAGVGAEWAWGGGIGICSVQHKTIFVRLVNTIHPHYKTITACHCELFICISQSNIYSLGSTHTNHQVIAVSEYYEPNYLCIGFTEATPVGSCSVTTLKVCSCENENKDKELISSNSPEEITCKRL